MFKKENNNISWEASSLEDEASVLDDIVHPKDNLQEVAIDTDLNDKLTRILTGGLNDNAPAINAQLYSSVDKFIENSPKTVDIILPVFNSMHIVEPCIKAVLSRTNYPFKLIIIDDASDVFTQTELQKLAATDERIIVIRNPVNKGFAASVNRGMKIGRGYYICLLNSDVLVTDRWLTKMVIALEADEKNQIVNPATNNTAQIDVPMSQGASYLTMNAIFEKYAKRRYPEIMPTGFCFMFRRNLISQIGYLDEAFVNYGEEDLSLQTQVLTSTGFKRNADLQVGDIVFDENGKQCKVLGFTETKYTRPCYEITFDTGEKIITDSTHRWEIYTQKLINAISLRGKTSKRLMSYENRARAKELFESGHTPKEVSKIFGISLRYAQEWQAKYKLEMLDKCFSPVKLTLTTEEIFLRGVTQPRINNYPLTPLKINVAKPLEFDSILNLPIDPYTLGVWLGDGYSANGHIGLDARDKEIFNNIPYNITSQRIYTKNRKHPFLDLGFSDLKKALESNNLINNKHIPQKYLFASKEQRLALLQGLMDTDGHCTKTGKCSFDNNDLQLIESVAFLVRSLGMKCTIPKASQKKGLAKNGLPYNPTHRVAFRPTKTTPVFKLARKLNRLKTPTRPHVNYHTIVDIKPIPSEPVRCICVDSPNHLFLVGNYLIPTHNSDLWMRCVTYTENGVFKKYRAVMADDTYLFHERGSSFSSLGQSAHMSLRSSAAGRFHAAWPQYGNWAKTFKPADTLGSLREPIPSREINQLLSKVKYRICWVVRSVEYCGAMKYIADLVNEINERGGDARVALIQRKAGENTNPLGELRSGVVKFADEEEFLASFKDKVFSNGYLVAATVEMAPVVKALCDSNRKLTPVLHIQSYEPMLVDSEEAKAQLNKMFQLIPNVISSSNWITEKLQEIGVKPFATINPGIDTKLFYPRGRDTGDDRFTVMLPLVTTYPFKGINRGIALARKLWNEAARRGIELRILAYGVDNIPDLKGVVTCLGSISPPRLAKLLGTEVDVFVDPAHVHSYGMPALEAMASGVPIVSWNNLGVKEYAKHGKTAILFNKNADENELVKAIFELFSSIDKRSELANNALTNVKENHDRNLLIPKFIQEFENRFFEIPSPKKVTFITPHLRKHGGPTTILSLANEMAKIGHDVSVLTVYDDINPDISNRTDLPIYVGVDQLRPCDVLISNSDNPHNSMFVNSTAVKKKVMLKLSHNERFKELEDSSLKLPWDKVVTTSNWLKECCEKPLPTWTHPPVQATRIGWYHYSHELFRLHPSEKKYNDEVVNVGMLVHHHPLKGSQDSVDALVKVKTLFNARVRIFAIGEVPAKQVQLPNWATYVANPSREDLAKLFKNLDIWVGASHTEGLGRLALECMSASVACVLSDTKSEFTVDGENCLLFPIGDTDTLATNVVKLIQYPDLKKKIAENGFKTAEMHSNPKHCVAALNAVIKE